jgi:hypothetical protein
MRCHEGSKVSIFHRRVAEVAEGRRGTQRDAEPWMIC